ncbi:MAG TPA: CPBP family intramembrane metalloprotease domain-containing protein, partial [Clostridium sp.]|nr:CPBP family intramembrane metalloprotease domain-containing protein [Clostridium sp.]
VQQISYFKEELTRISIRVVMIILQEILPIIICIILWKALDKKSLQELGMTNLKKDWKWLVEGLIIGSVLLTVVAIILLLTNSAVIKGSIFEPNFSISIIGGFIIYIFVGFSEEILCRGYCLSVLKQCKKRWVPYVGSAIIFALLHSLNSGICFTAYINLFLFGLFLAYVVYKTKNLWFGIGVHITWNFFEGSVFGFLVSGGNISESIYYLQSRNYEIINGGTFGPEGGLAVTFVLVLSIFLTYKFCHKVERI